MASEGRPRGGDLFIVDNSDSHWKVRTYLSEWCDIARAMDIATAYFEIGALVGLDGQWQKLDSIRILMGDEVSKRTRRALLDGIATSLDRSVEHEKQRNDFLKGVAAIVAALQSGQIQCRVYTRAKFHAKAYITHARHAVVGPAALVGSSNLTLPGLTQNVELNVQLRREVDQLQDWFERHWDDAEDVTPEILRVIERHTADYSPFEVYAKSLQQYFKGHEETVTEWERSTSKMWPVLDQYQREGYQSLMKIGGAYRGAFLCDGVGLGKTFVGLMLIERLLHDRKNVALFIPKAANEPVWQAALERYLPEHLGRSYNRLQVFNHTDLLRGGEFPQELDRVRQFVDAVVIDEAHHFRNRGTTGEGPLTKPSRYRMMYDLLEGKQLFMLTATPINNSLRDLEHMIELFSRRQPGYFKDAPLGIHTLRGHFRKMESDLEKILESQRNGLRSEDDDAVTDEAEAEKVLLNDSLFRALVVQRSRKYVRLSQEQQLGKAAAIFPRREPPIVVDYSLKRTYGPVLDYIEKAFAKDEPLFFLTAYYPLKYFTGDREKFVADNPEGPLSGFKFQEGRQKSVVRLIRIQFLKRFESSFRAFEGSCEELMVKLLAFTMRNATEPSEKARLRTFEDANASTLARIRANRQARRGDTEEDEEDFELISDDTLEKQPALPGDQFDIPKILDENFADLDELAAFLGKLQSLTDSRDDKLAKLKDLLTTHSLLRDHKVLIFSEYMDTARYLKRQLTEAGISVVDEVDSNVKGSCTDTLARFSPYYNGSSPAALATRKLPETRVLIATDVLSEGLNLQDATFLINYDLHWNPVRLMQRIGRVDRRMSPDIEEQIKSEHPDRAAIRGVVQYWNFLPPSELEDLIGIYAKLAHKTLRISKTLGIEGKKLLTPQDDFDALKEFNETYEGQLTTDEEMHLAYQQLLKDNPGLEDRLANLPGRVFSGKQHQSGPGNSPGQLLNATSRAVFFCYALPGFDREKAASLSEADSPSLAWTEASGRTAWYLYDLDSGAILEDAAEIFHHVECEPATPRRAVVTKETLISARKKLDAHIKNTYLKQTDAPVGVSPILKAWMELS